MRTSFAAAAVVSLSLLAYRGPEAQNTPDQRTISRQLLSGNLQERHSAFDSARGIPVDRRGSELRGALIELLDRENKLVASVLERREILAEYEDPEFIAQLARVVAELRDPRAIAVLSEATYGGLTAVRALAHFGEEAVPAIVKVVRARRSHYDLVNHGLIALRFIAEDARTSALSTDAVGAIKRAADERLTGKQHFTTLWRAIDLAVVLEDPELTAKVSALALDREQVVARGVADLETIERTQQHARDRLAGHPALPRR